MRRFCSYCAAMKLALCALLAFSIVGCTRSSINMHRETFEPTKRKGPWADEYRDSLNRNPRNPDRPLYREVN
jgi:hypothetical protein